MREGEGLAGSHSQATCERGGGPGWVSFPGCLWESGRMSSCGTVCVSKLSTYALLCNFRLVGVKTAASIADKVHSDLTLPADQVIPVLHGMYVPGLS